MAILPEYKTYLIVKTAMRFSISLDFAKAFIDNVEREKGLTGYEENLERAMDYNDLFYFYFKKD